PPVGDLRVPNSPLPGSPILATILDRSKDAIMGFSSLVDVKVIDSGIYFVLDRKRNRVFSYDHDGNLLFLFGSFGSRKGSFGDPVSIDVFQDEVYVLNSQDTRIDVFKPTDYGSALLQASRLYKNGKYAEAENMWSKILNMNANLEQAYIMIGKIHMQRQDYSKAMSYFKNGNSKGNYSKAFRLYRSEIIENNFLLIVGAIILAGVLFSILRRLLKKASALSGVAGKAITSAGYAVYTCFHPFDGFYDIKHEKKGGLLTATIILGLTAVTTLLESTYTAFIFNYNNPKYVNIPFIILTKLLPLIMFVISNWCLTTLMDGKGKFKDIYIYVCYSQLPILMLNTPIILVSHILTIEEGAFYTAILSISSIWSLLIMAVGTMITHDYTVKKTIVTLILTVAGILIISFLCLFFMTIVENIWKFIDVLMYEITLL
ncbi:MAG: YIP1 family protein, partial [Clostridia bacterium]|nr:YIP1 family protein [Clostridia bacterium]